MFRDIRLLYDGELIKIKMVEIKTKNIGDVKVRKSMCSGVVTTFEDRIQRYIKQNMGIKD